MSVNGSTASTTTVDHDVVIVGAGFSGIASLYHAQKAGLNVTLIEAGDDVGGTWYWNTYPGASTDTEAWCYCFPFEQKTLGEYRWTHRFPEQEEVQGYLAFAVDRLDLRKNIQFSTRVESMRYDESTNLWTVTTEAGKSIVTNYVITAVGGLSTPYLPDIPGLDSFAGQTLLTSRWPKEGADLEGKRVGLVGTGSTGVQILTHLADVAKDVYVFQRTPNFVLNGPNYPIDDDRWTNIASGQADIWDKIYNHYFAFPLPPANRLTTDVSDEEREEIFEQRWQEGGFGFSFSTFDDLMDTTQANDYAAEFIRRKIREAVTDPETAELLTPRDYPYGGKRPPVGRNYYELYNRENVHLVDVSKRPIGEFTETAARVGDDEYELDAVVFATGFDALTGALSAMEIVGRDGQRLDEEWAQGVRTHTGLATAGFPNMFFVYGPQTPHANIPPTVEKAAKWAVGAITYLRAHDLDYMEAESAAEQEWFDAVQDAANATILPAASGETKAWFLGANIPGKAVGALVYLGGAHNYYERMAKMEENGYPGFDLQKRGSVARLEAISR